MTGSTPRTYRAAIWLYPCSFRREFGGDLDQAFRDLRHDHSAFATWRRITADLALTIPTQHLEAFMARSTSAPAVTLASGAVLLAAIATAVASGRTVVFLPALLIGAHEIHNDWDWFPWRLLILSVFAGWALIATGVLLAIVHFVHRLTHRPAGV